MLRATFLFRNQAHLFWQAENNFCFISLGIFIIAADSTCMCALAIQLARNRYRQFKFYELNIFTIVWMVIGLFRVH